MAAVKLWRCLQCKKEFEAAAPACTDCEIDPKKDPRDKDLIVEMRLIHFDPPSKREGRGLGYAACNPGLKVGRGNHGFTGEPDAVTCAKCKATEVYATAEGSNGAVELKVAELKPCTGC